VLGAGDLIASDEIDMPLAAGSAVEFAVNPGDVVAVIAHEGAAMQTSNDNLFGLLKIIGDPTSAQARLQEISARDAAVTEKEAALRALTAKVDADRKAAEQEHDRREQRIMESESRLSAREERAQRRDAALREQERQARGAADQLAVLNAEIAERSGILDRLRSDLAAIRQKVA
jgi:hypothetical protein